MVSLALSACSHEQTKQPSDKEIATAQKFLEKTKNIPLYFLGEKSREAIVLSRKDDSYAFFAHFKHADLLLEDGSTYAVEDRAADVLGDIRPGDHIAFVDEDGILFSDSVRLLHKHAVEISQ